MFSEPGLLNVVLLSERVCIARICRRYVAFSIVHYVHNMLECDNSEKSVDGRSPHCHHVSVQVTVALAIQVMLGLFLACRG